MRRATSTLGAVALAALMLVSAAAPVAATEGVNVVDANARAGGNDKATAVAIGDRLFARSWSAQILKIFADGFGSHKIAGLRLSGVKFHRPLTRGAFIDEVVAIIGETFAAAPVEEVDLWCIVPLNVGKGVVVSGDFAHPSHRTVFTVTVLRGEATPALAARIREGKTVYWDGLWVHQALR